MLHDFFLKTQAHIHKQIHATWYMQTHPRFFFSGKDDCKILLSDVFCFHQRNFFLSPSPDPKEAVMHRNAVVMTTVPQT